jgi:lysophospholipase L1-like esterase
VSALRRGGWYSGILLIAALLVSHAAPREATAQTPEVQPSTSTSGELRDLAGSDPIEGDWHFPGIGDIRIRRAGPSAFQGISLTDVVYETSGCVLTPNGSAVWPSIVGRAGSYRGSVYWAEVGDDYCRQHGADPNGQFLVDGDEMSVCSVDPEDAEANPSCFYGHRTALAVRRYVALGDSFSSGEANPPFTGGKCHRSMGAWPSILARGSSVLELQANLACSGARTKALTESYKGQRPQLDELPAGAEVVTITIGGNDVGFAQVLKNCVFRNCVRSGRLERARREITELARRLIGVYKSVQGRLEAGQLVVVGYPRLFPLDPSRKRCVWLTPGEAEQLDRLTGLLDREIHSAAIKAAADYVSALEALSGHELCTRKSWVYSLNAIGLQKQGHPTERGQQAIATLVAQALY